MALIKQIELDNGIILTEAYIKVSSVIFYNKANDNSYVKIDVNIFKDQQARIDAKPEVTKFIYKISDPKFTEYFSISVLNVINKNIISQAYIYLKTLNTFSGATDVSDSKE